MGTQLHALGLGGDCPERWNVENPAALESIHRAYLDAGAQLLLTNTFGASEWKLARSGYAPAAERFCHAAVQNALSAAANRHAYVLGDVGPTGELPAPFGQHPLDDFEAVFAAQIGILAAAGVHGIIIETMSCGDEAAAAVRAAKRTSGLPVLACMTYSQGKTGYRTMMGETVAQTTRKLLDAGADALGSNCGLGSGPMADIVRELRTAASCPIIAKPNAGHPHLVAGKTVFDQAPDDWAALMPEVLRAGANIVGGCCGTTPAHIARLRQLVAPTSPKPPAATL